MTAHQLVHALAGTSGLAGLALGALEVSRPTVAASPANADGEKPGRTAASTVTTDWATR